jgi:Domain of unknown function (DUF4253)
MTEAGPLPEDGPALVAGVQLPAGQRIYGHGEEAVAWVTTGRMQEAADAFLALSAGHPRTGLVPVLVSSVDPIDNSREALLGFYGRENLSLLDSLSAETVLEEGWDVGGDEELDQAMADVRAPFGVDFPELAAAEHTPLPAAALRAAVTAERSSFLALVSASRPADVPAAVGWSVFGVDEPGSREARSLRISTVLRSWETRFGARPLRIGSDAILRVLVERPPSTFEAAIRVAAEHLAFGDEYGSYSGQPISELAAELVGKPVWHFWWD